MQPDGSKGVPPVRTVEPAVLAIVGLDVPSLKALCFALTSLSTQR
jgi:hypothetical protein